MGYHLKDRSVRQPGTNLRRAYDANGQPLSESALGNRYLFQGREYSWETGLYYFRARWYDPHVGRWLSNDPIGISGGLNEYAAFGNNPVGFVDPWGLTHTRVAHERDAIISESRAWYATSPRRRPGYACGQQADALIRHLNRAFSPQQRQYWNFVPIGGARARPMGFPWRQHQVVYVSPTSAAAAQGYRGFVIDPFKGYLPEDDIRLMTYMAFRRMYPLDMYRNWFRRTDDPFFDPDGLLDGGSHASSANAAVSPTDLGVSCE